jgi:hypothetical protein
MDENEPLEWYERLFLRVVVGCIVVVELVVFLPLLGIMLVMSPLFLLSPETLGFRSSASGYSTRSGRFG